MLFRSENNVEDQPYQCDRKTDPQADCRRLAVALIFLHISGLVGTVRLAREYASDNTHNHGNQVASAAAQNPKDGECNLHSERVLHWLTVLVVEHRRLAIVYASICISRILAVRLTIRLLTVRLLSIGIILSVSVILSIGVILSVRILSLAVRALLSVILLTVRLAHIPLAVRIFCLTVVLTVRLACILLSIRLTCAFLSITVSRLAVCIRSRLGVRLRHSAIRCRVRLTVCTLCSRLTVHILRSRLILCPRRSQLCLCLDVLKIVIFVPIQNQLMSPCFQNFFQKITLITTLV